MGGYGHMVRSAGHEKRLPLCRDEQELAQLCDMVEKHLHRLHTDSRYARLWQRRALVLAMYRKLTAHR